MLHFRISYGSPPYKNRHSTLDTMTHVRNYTPRTATGRAQRASARNQGGNTSILDPSMQLEVGTSSASQPILLESDSGTAVVDDEVSISRSNSSLNLQDSVLPALGGRSKRKDKGKAKEVDTPPLRVKEEPKPFSLHTPEPPSNLVSPSTNFHICPSYQLAVK